MPDFERNAFLHNFKEHAMIPILVSIREILNRLPVDMENTSDVAINIAEFLLEYYEIDS